MEKSSPEPKATVEYTDQELLDILGWKTQNRAQKRRRFTPKHTRYRTLADETLQIWHTTKPSKVQKKIKNRITDKIAKVSRKKNRHG